jgi:thermospermine synthase
MVGAMPAAEALPREVTAGNGYGAKHLHLQLPTPPKQQQQPAEAECRWYEEEIDDDLKLCYALNR